ncbi:NAD-dependent epimerase/dehydratase family protein [Celeribacter persicus]|uniref:UDP-glucose 4-epimerase n=2 Tax=Celeribacter persicus TaxID=1651082 RepID=A0A2T5HTQ7_9RHOB|nr:NAD-dependent epimerase/dehydratase family protein [Celeribacter persicus]
MGPVMPDHHAAYLGASGRIGRLLRAAQRQVSENGVALFWQYRTLDIPDEAAFLWSDFNDPAPLVAAQARHGFDRFLIFSGAIGAKDDSEAMQAHVTNVNHALTAALKAGIPRVLVASSSAVYGLGREQPFHEEDALAPINAYGRAKVEMEALCARRAETEGIEICALRIGNVAGADMLLRNAASRSVHPLTLDIFPDGQGPQRSYIGPMTLFSVLRALIATQESLPPVLNLAGGRPVRMNDLLEAAAVPWVRCKRTDPGHQNITLDTTRLSVLCPGVDLSGGAVEIVREWQVLRAMV